MTEAPTTILVVIHPFGNHAKGEIISDPAAIAAVRQTGQSSRVIATMLPGEPASNQGAH